MKGKSYLWIAASLIGSSLVLPATFRAAEKDMMRDEKGMMKDQKVMENGKDGMMKEGKGQKTKNKMKDEKSGKGAMADDKMKMEENKK
jgi:hypothetical protein